MDRNTTIKVVRRTVEALAATNSEISCALLFETLGIESQMDKAKVRSRLTNMVKHGELTRTERGSFIFNHTLKPRNGSRYDSIWRFVRAAKPGWSIEECCLMTHSSFRHVRRYMDWLETEGFVKLEGRNEKNASTYSNTSKARMNPETPFPPIRETDPFAKERAAAACITRLMLCADPYTYKTARLITDACHILLARFERGTPASKNNSNSRMENENEEENNVEQ